MTSRTTASFLLNAAPCSGIYLYVSAAVTSAPLSMSSRATASCPSSTTMCSGVRPLSPTAEASAPPKIRRHTISRSPNSLARRSNRSLQAFFTTGFDSNIFAKIRLSPNAPTDERRSPPPNRTACALRQKGSLEYDFAVKWRYLSHLSWFSSDINIVQRRVKIWQPLMSTTREVPWPKYRRVVERLRGSVNGSEGR